MSNWIMMKRDKPLGRKAYGSIGHLPSSRLGDGDHCITPGQARICCEKTRDKHDTVIVQEKLDGSNMSVANINGQIVALGRAGYRASSSPYEFQRKFDDWVRNNKTRFEVLREGERLCGEWLYQAHGLIYDLPHEPYVVFDIINGDNDRIIYDELIDRVGHTFVTAGLVSKGEPIKIAKVMERLAQPKSYHGCREVPEGAVWRVERNGKVDFLAKYVRHDKQDGKYLPEISGKDAVNNNYRSIS